MKNITLAVEEDVLERARVYAAKRKTTINRLVRDHLRELADSESRLDKARDELLRMIDESPGRLGPGWKWSREDAYEGRLLSGHKRSALRRVGKDR